MTLKNVPKAQLSQRGGRIPAVNFRQERNNSAHNAQQQGGFSADVILTLSAAECGGSQGEETA